MRRKELEQFQKIEEKLILALDKPAKEFINDFLVIFSCYAKFPYPQHLRICRNPYFTFEGGLGFYSDGSAKCREEIVLAHEFTTALYAWGLWGEHLEFPLKEGGLIGAKEWTFFEKVGIRFCEYVLELFPQCGENTALFSGFPLGGSHGQGILPAIPLELQGKKHQPFSIT